MDMNLFVLIVVVAVVLGLFISYFIMRSANGVSDRERQLKLQNRILLHIAEKLGVEKEKLIEFEKLNNE